jgi:hypothetical protein
MATKTPQLKLVRISNKAQVFVNSKKIHPREGFYETLDRILGIKKDVKS